MSDLHDLYLVHAANCSKQSELTKKENLAILREHENRIPLGKEKTNSTLALTFAGAREPNPLSHSESKIAYSRAIEAQQHARLAIEAIRASRTAKQAAIEQIRDLESIRKEDEKEKRIIRADTGLVRTPKEFSFFRASDSEGRPELSDSRKLVYNAAKAIEKENK